MSALIPSVDAVLLKNVDTTYYQVGQPFHIHTERQDVGGAAWACSSPYCEQIVGVNMPGHGGPAVIFKGQEPWRGR